MRYVLDFGTANAGGSPTFTVFDRTDTLAALTPPAIGEIGAGLYYFDYDWASAPSGVSSIAYKMTLAGVELAGVIETTVIAASGTTYMPAAVGAIPVVVTGAVAQPALYETAGTIIQRAGLQIGLGNISDPYASTDPNILQLCEFLRQSGDDLSTQHDWTAMVREATFTTDGVSDTVSLPPDFYDFVDGTGWNRSTRWPLIGPLSPQDVQFLKARLVNVLIQIAYRKVGGNLVFPIIPGAGSVCAFEYQSTYWVQSSGAPGPDKKAPTVSTDLVIYDADLMVAAVKLRWAEEKGFDTTLARARYDEKLGYMIGKDVGGQSLGLAGRARPFDRMINADNVPPGNWGV